MAKSERQKIKDAITKLPNLCDFGAGIHIDPGERLSFDECRERLEADQEHLLNRTSEFKKTCAWLKPIEKIKSIHTDITSYGLKHYAEKDIGYISNGVFIAAAIHCGFRVDVELGSPNVYFNMSKRSIGTVICQQRAN